MLAEKIPYYILDLLQQSPSVQVPGLGRFEAIFHPAVIDMPGAQIKPPYVEPDFSDDQDAPGDLLAAYIHYATGEDPEAISEALKLFVKRVFQSTEEGQTYPIDKFGTFSKSASGGIRFTPDWDAFNLSFSGLEVLDIKPATPVSTSVPIYPAEKPRTFIPEEPVVPAYTEPAPNETYVKPPLSFTPVLPEDGIQHISIVDENTSRLWWMILISAIVLITVLCAYLAWDIISNRNKLNDLRQISPDTMAVTRVEETPPVLDTQSIAIEEVPINVPDEPTQEEPPIQPDASPDGEPCYIIVGAFRDPANVDKMVLRLHDLGYTTEEIKGGTLTKVAIRTSCDQATLQKVLNEARSSINPEAWIY